MDNENKENIDSTNDEAKGQDGEQGQDNNQDNKHQETPEAKRARLTRQLEQLDKKHPVEKKEESQTQKTNELDYGQKAFLLANGIKGTDEINLVKTVMQNTGKSLDDVLESKYFMAEIKELREIKSSEEAMPQGSKKSGASSKDTVEYWIAKGELPPSTDRELRQKVVNARIKSESTSRMFTDNSVAGI